MVKFKIILIALLSFGSTLSQANSKNTVDKVVYDNVTISPADLTLYRGPAVDPEDDQLGNSRRTSNPLTGGIAQIIKDLFTPSLLQDLYKLLILKPPTKLTKPRVFKHGTIEEVKKYLSLSLISLCFKEDIIGLNCGCSRGIADVSIIENSEFKSLVYIGADTTNKLIVVSYRGTVFLQNWISDFAYQKVDYPYLAEGVKVHHGLLDHYLSSYHDVQNAVKKLLINPKYKGYTLHITGYSLGAAVSTLSLPNWVRLLKEMNDNRPIQNFAYSSLRVGNDKFAEYLHSLNVPITRYTNANDIVPHVPPRSFDFVHVGGEIHEKKTSILGTTELVVCGQGTYDENPECSWKDKAPISLLRHAFPMHKFTIASFCTN